jgi:hypothetical protein
MTRPVVLSVGVHVYGRGCVHRSFRVPVARYTALDSSRWCWWCGYSQGDLDKSKAHLLKALQMDPDAVQCQKDLREVKNLQGHHTRGNDAFTVRMCVWVWVCALPGVCALP